MANPSLTTYFVAMQELAQCKHFIFDIDGVLTSGSVLVTEAGDMLRSVNIKDGYALQHAIKMGFKIAIISGGSSNGMLKRFKGLGIEDIYLSQKNKVSAFNELLQKWNITPNSICYCGDDMPDIPLLKLAGISTCPADAATDVKEISSYILPVNGGNGCARFLLENALKMQDLWHSNEAFSW